MRVLSTPTFARLLAALVIGAAWVVFGAACVAPSQKASSEEDDRGTASASTAPASASDRPPAAIIGPPPPQPRPAPPFPVMPGIDVLEAQGFAVLAGKRVGLLTHDAAASRTGEPTWSVLLRARSRGVRLVALFAAEHGLDGKAPASALIENQTHQASGLPLWSLYGSSRQPTKNLLKQIDVMVIDLQDIGSRSYTFAAAMRETMEACFRHGVEVVVLDRPNPLGGTKVDGPGVDPEWNSYVSAFPVPYVHGLTIGELARFALATPGVLDLDEKARTSARLTVVPMRGWRRSMRWPDTGLAWRQTSPYVPDFEAVEGYAMTGLGCQLGGWTHGIGKAHPFRGLYYPGLRAAAIAQMLADLRLPGVSFRRVEMDGEAGKKTEGVYVAIDDWEKLRPTELSFHLMRLACALGGTNPFATATARQQQGFNRHVGSTAWWQAIARQGAKVDVPSFVARWSTEAAAFRERSRAFWLYPDDTPTAAATRAPGASPVGSTPPASSSAP